ncbi:MAG: hypothetical protein M2R45_03731 [Verrucomicrobia subdivision 3 bacterium]|nr:hypothetical protein [Limisphaerales bacterium]
MFNQSIEGEAASSASEAVELSETITETDGVASRMECGLDSWA